MCCSRFRAPARPGGGRRRCVRGRQRGRAPPPRGTAVIRGAVHRHHHRCPRLPHRRAVRHRHVHRDSASAPKAQQQPARPEARCGPCDNQHEQRGRAARQTFAQALQRHHVQERPHRRLRTPLLQWCGQNFKRLF